MRRWVFWGVGQPEGWKALSTLHPFLCLGNGPQCESWREEQSCLLLKKLKLCAFPDPWWLEFFACYLSWEKLNPSTWDFGSGDNGEQFRILCSCSHSSQLPEVTVRGWVGSIGGSEVAALIDFSCDVILAVDPTAWLPLLTAHCQSWFSKSSC